MCCVIYPNLTALLRGLFQLVRQLVLLPSAQTELTLKGPFVSKVNSLPWWKTCWHVI